jgi:hypothetical protein
VSRLAKDMQDSQVGRKLSVTLSDDKRHLGCPAGWLRFR